MGIGQLTGKSNRENDMRKKHSAIVMGTAVVLAIGVALVIQATAGGGVSSESSSVKDQTKKVSSTEKVAEAVDYAEITALKGQLGLDTSTMAAMGCGSEDAKAVLKGLKAWYASNAARLKANRATRKEAIKSLKTGRKGRRVSPADVAAARRSLQAAVKARREMVKDAKADMEAILPRAKQRIWKAAGANAGLPSPYRFIPDLTDEQRKTLRDARTALARRRAAATNDQQWAAVQQAFVRTVDQTLSFTQKQDLKQVKTNLRRCSSEVVSATGEVFPKPELLQDSEVDAMPEMTEDLRRKLETKLK